jgi:hypothetical protein
MQPPSHASGVVAESPLVLTDAVIDDGVIGHSVVFTHERRAQTHRRPRPQPRAIGRR